MDKKLLRVNLAIRFMTGICVVLAGLTACGHLQVGLAWQHWLLGWGLWTFVIPTAICIWAVEISCRVGTGEKRRD